MTLIVRPEQPADYPAIRRVVAAAFRGNAEAELVENLRANGGVTLALVAEEDGQIVGHILYSPVTVESDEGSFVAQALAPLSVLPSQQRQGIGVALVTASLEALRRQGHEIVFALGDPAYYPRFGFVLATPLGFRSVYTMGAGDHPEYRVIALRDGALEGKSGFVHYRGEFARL